MANWLKYVIAFTASFALMLAFRTLAFSIHGVTGDGLEPTYQSGDRLLINRCSYGLRIEGNALLPYSRLMRQPVEKGDIVAFSVPGDTIRTPKGLITIPGLRSCAKNDYYWLEALNSSNPIDSRNLGCIPENNIVGRVVTVLYNRNNSFLP